MQRTATIVLVMTSALGLVIGLSGRASGPGTSPKGLGWQEGCAQASRFRAPVKRQSRRF